MPDILRQTTLSLSPTVELLRREIPVDTPADLVGLRGDLPWRRSPLDQSRSEVVATRPRGKNSSEVVGIVPARELPDAWAVWRRRGRGATRYVLAVTGTRDDARQAALRELTKAMPPLRDPSSRVDATRDDLVGLVELGVDVASRIIADGCTGGPEQLASAAQFRMPDVALGKGDALLVEVVAVSVAALVLRRVAEG